ncbi:hypothetical protein K443DRAFT_122637 [Laccaria amethystina LaAM-08-1]|uniref:Uncharacterized protein n=1 Tax=Laccaria amethystina LaAM-08-1 TaxID=1095629 RepID=A0A0C9X6Z8_9AGAR|nr:hypothetical protein K443DRAFT_122637 [Laccaria amethystina LaAM-08-1]
MRVNFNPSLLGDLTHCSKTIKYPSDMATRNSEVHFGLCVGFDTACLQVDCSAAYVPQPHTLCGDLADCLKTIRGRFGLCMLGSVRTVFFFEKKLGIKHLLRYIDQKCGRSKVEGDGGE